MPSTTSTVNGTKKNSYLSRVLSVNGGSSKTEKSDKNTVSSKWDNDNNNNNPFASRNGSFRRSSSKNLKRANEELRSHVTRLKAEIELEKIKSKQTHRDKVADIKRMKDQYERANSLSIEAVTQKMKNLSEVETKKLKESLNRDKDAEIKQIIKFKDEEIKTLRKSMHEETERLNRQLQYATSSSSRRNRFGNAPNHDDNEIGRLKIELTKLSKENENLEDRYSGLLLGMNQKNEMMKKMKVDHERELQKILRQARRENSQSVSELQTLRKSLQDKDAEISRLDSCVLKVTEEKEHFEEKFDKNVLLSSSFTADKNDHPRSLQSKNAELKNQLDAAYLKIRQLEKDNLNSTGNHTFDLSKSFRLDSKVKQLKTRNSELVAIAKKLEEKAKNVQIEFDDYRRDVENQEDSKGKIKASFSKQRAKDLTEHARAMLIKEQEIEKLKQNSPRIEELEASLHLSEKERLRLERQLKSPPITPRISEEEYNTLKESKNKIVKEFSDFQQLHTSCLQIKEDLSKKLKLLKEINQQLESKEEECVALSKSLMTTQQEMGFLKREMAEEQHRHQQIKKQNEIQRLSLKNMEEENEKLSRKIQSMIKLEKDFDILKNRMNEKEEEYNQLFSEMEYCKQTISTLNKKLSLHEERLENLLLEKTDVQNRLVERDLEIDKLHQELSDFQTHHGSEISDMQRELHEACQQNQLLRKTALQLNQQIKENTNMVFHSVAVQTNSDHHNNNKISSNHYRLSDNVFDSPKEPLMASSTANENTPNNHVTIKITKPAAASSVENSEIEDENFSIKSDNLMDFAAKRIDELAISQSDATSISDAQPPPPFMSNISGITSHDHDVIKSRHDDDTDDDVSSVEELQCDDENDALPRKRLPEEEIENQDLQLRNLDDKDDFPVKLFQAKYTYDPSLYSPNADHEMELPLIAGQYLYIYGDVDKDGFYIGETKNGERGLIPSNLIQRVEDEFAINEDLPFDVSDSDLSEVKKKLQQKQKDIGSPLAAEYLANTNRLKAKYNYHKHGQPVTSLIDDRDLIMSLDTSKDNFVEVPWPTDVEIERQMGDSVIVKWNIPVGINTRDIQGYSIQVDGEHRQTVLGSARTKALISNLNLDKVTRVSVCTVTNDGRESDDTESSIIVGGSQVNGTTLALDKDLKPKPSNTKLVRRASEDEIIANFFEQLKKVVTTATNKSISSPRPLSMASPRLPEPEDDTRPQQDQTTSMEQLKQIDGDETHPMKPDLNSEDDEKPRILNPENQNKPRIYNPENEEKPRTFNPENDPDFQRLSLPEGERIVISDDELSVIMEETESNDDILTSNNLDIPNQQARGLRASPDGEENTEISNLIRANQLQEDSYELITEETLEQKFSKRQNSEPVHEEIFEQMYQTKQEHQPADLPLFDFQPPETNTSEALAESDEITDDSPSMNSALTKKTEFEQRINESLKLLDTGEINNRKTIDPNLLSHQTDEDSLGSIDQGITKRDLSRDSPTNSIIEDSMGRDSSSSNETSNLRNSETYDFGEDVDMLYSEGEDLSPILSRQNSMSKSSRQSNEHFTLKNNNNHSNVTIRKDQHDTQSESQPESAKSTPRSRGSRKRNSLIDTLSSASHEKGNAIGKQPGSSQSTPRLLSGRNSILDSESLSMGLLNDSKRTDDRNSIRIDKETSSLNSTPRSISKHSSKRNSENEFSIDHKNEKSTPRLLSSKRSSLDSDFSDLLPPDSIHSHTSKTSENNITKSTSSRKSSKRDSKKNSENSSAQDFDAIDDHAKIKSNNSTPRLSSTRSSKRNSLSLLASDFPLESLDTARSDGSRISLESLTKQHATSGSENSTPRDTSGRSSKDDKKDETSQDILSARSKKSDSRSNSKNSTPRISSGRKSGEENIDEHSQDLSSARLNASKRSDKLNNLLNVENAPSPRDDITKTKSPKLPYDVTYGSFGHGQNDTIESNMEESTRSTLKTEKEQSVELGESDNEEQQLTNSISSSRKDEIRNSLLKGLKNQFKKSGNKKLSKSNSNTSSIIEDISSLKSLLKDSSQASNKSSIKDGNKVVRSHSESSRKSTTLRSEKEKSQSTEKDFFSLPSSVQSSPHISDKRKSKSEKETDLRKNSFSSNHSRPPLQSQQSRDSKKAFDSRKSSRVSPDFSQSTDKDVNSLPNSINGSPRPQLSKKWFNSKNNSPSTKSKSDHDPNAYHKVRHADTSFQV
ncbi:serine-rich adhesin for platelets-like [Clytia hemisphaerica]